MKKKYIKPTIIDLSIERMTGFGYGVLSSDCTTGVGFTVGTCGNGPSANAACNPGTLPTNGCNEGNLPSAGGTSCMTGDTATGRQCYAGESVSGLYPYCYTGGSGLPHGNADCGNGDTANYCGFGNADAGGLS